MTVRKVKNIWHHEHHNIHHARHRDALASSYFNASLIALLFAAIVIMIGLFAIGDTMESYFEEKPMINIVLPPQV